MARPEIDLGPTTRRVAADVKRLRELHKLSFAELERRLAEAGRPIPSLGLRNIEAGKRRIDVDELVALADVLEVTPFVLLTGGLDMTDREFFDAMLEERPDIRLFADPKHYDDNLDEIFGRVRSHLRAEIEQGRGGRTGQDRDRERGVDRGDG